MNQAQVLSLENYRILRTISLGEHFYINDIAYSERGTVFLSATNPLYNIPSVPTGMNGVRILLPTGSYINYKYSRFYYIEDNIVNSCSPTDCSIKIKAPRYFKMKQTKSFFKLMALRLANQASSSSVSRTVGLKNRALGKLLNYGTLITTEMK